MMDDDFGQHGSDNFTFLRKPFKVRMSINKLSLSFFLFFVAQIESLKGYESEMVAFNKGSRKWVVTFFN